MFHPAKHLRGCVFVCVCVCVCVCVHARVYFLALMYFPSFFQEVLK